ncbi:MAG: hypothetical protein RLZ28_1119, partial [Actinomycetota bacterium]
MFGSSVADQVPDLGSMETKRYETEIT